MTTSHWCMRARRAAAATALGLVVLAVGVPGQVRAADDDEPNSIWNLDKRILDGFMRGLGLRNGREAEIDYHERSPLVLPPSRDLPPPEQASNGRPADWPVDPDVKRRKDFAAAKRKKLDQRGYDEDYEQRALLPSELDGHRPGHVSPPPAPGTEKDPEGTPMRPSELGYLGGLFSAANFWGKKKEEEVGTFTKEPPRVSLTAPPAGYQTPSTGQAYGTFKHKVRSKVTPLDPAVGDLGE